MAFGALSHDGFWRPYLPQVIGRMVNWV
jgi:hypothetical protein